MHFEGDVIDDFVLLRSDGNPTYHLSVVVDDIDMQITDVARGDDHLSNTPKHILLFRAFGAESPAFAHLPLILGSDRKRLSKRSGATSVEEYRDLGILPEALFNFLTLLGWSPGGDRELFTRDEASALFDLSDVNKSPAIFDVEKLLWMNGQYLMRLPANKIEQHLKPFLDGATGNLAPMIELHKPRARTLRDLADQLRVYLKDDVEYDEDAVRKYVKDDSVGERMQRLREALSAVDPFDVASTEQALRALADRLGVSAAKLIHPFRLALTGRGASPPIFDVVALMGRQRTLQRLDRLIARIPELAKTGTLAE
jgi:glutamyl-tRNA synthetase